jgi:hypothetical protein
MVLGVVLGETDGVVSGAVGVIGLTSGPVGIGGVTGVTGVTTFVLGLTVTESPGRTTVSGLVVAFVTLPELSITKTLLVTGSTETTMFVGVVGAAGVSLLPVTTISPTSVAGAT